MMDLHAQIINYLLILIWWNCLPAMTSAWYFKEPLRNETKSFLISKFCFPWLLYSVTPSNSTHYYLISSILPLIQRICQPKSKLRRIYVCTPSLDKVLLVNSSTLIGEKNSSFMIQIGTGDWLSCELWTIVISIWNNYRWAECIENRKEDWPWECPFTKRGIVAVYPRSLRA